ARRHRVADAVEVLAKAGVPAAAVLAPREIGTVEQLHARGWFEVVEHPVLGPHPMPSLPFRFASRAGAPWLRRAAPTLGQHTDEVLAGLGVTPSELAELAAAGVTGTRPAGL
nr:CoA transferase [Micromonospora sp. DSM 115978]